MKREYPESPLVGVGAVIVDAHGDVHGNDKRVLLIRRGTAPLLGEWSLPGGLLECGETLRKAVIRDRLESLAITNPWSPVLLTRWVVFPPGEAAISNTSKKLSPSTFFYRSLQ